MHPSTNSRFGLGFECGVFPGRLVQFLRSVRRVADVNTASLHDVFFSVRRFN